MKIDHQVWLIEIKYSNQFAIGWAFPNFLLECYAEWVCMYITISPYALYRFRAQWNAFIDRSLYFSSFYTVLCYWQQPPPTREAFYGLIFYNQKPMLKIAANIFTFVFFRWVQKYISFCVEALRRSIYALMNLLNTWNFFQGNLKIRKVCSNQRLMEKI